MDPVESVKSINKKALGLARTPKSKRPIQPKIPRSSSPVIPLYRQKWFMSLCDRLRTGERIYQGKVKGMGLIPDEKVLCDHTNCRHREVFHATEVPIMGSSHIRKSDYYILLWNNKKEIVVI